MVDGEHVDLVLTDKAIHDSVGLLNYFADGWIGELGNRPPRLWEVTEPVDSADDSRTTTEAKWGESRPMNA